jgi:uncharacterized DUF497 family protein
VSLLFEWDRTKASINLKKHRVSFEEASSVFGDPMTITIEDPQVKSSEYRFVSIGRSVLEQLLVVVHTERNDRIRIISARKTTKAERSQYEE